MKSNLYGYSDPYILLSGAITTDGSGDNDTAKQASTKQIVHHLLIT